MPKVAKGRRKRAYRPKTRSGCLTCKVRRVKCDEKQPACLRCTSTGRACNGYNDVGPPPLPPSSVVRVVRGPSLEVQESPRVKRSFAFFLQRTCPQLAGFFGSDFWERLVFQAAYHEPSVRHAIVAIGAVHEKFEHQAETADATMPFALEQYNLAIRELLVPLSQSDKRGIDVCLISCILFACFENIQGNHATAGIHIQSGTKLLREVFFDKQNGVLHHPVLGPKIDALSYASFDVLAGIFAGLGSQVTMIVGASKHSHYESIFSDAIYDGISLSFSSIEEAKSIFEYGRCLFASGKAAQISCHPVDVPDPVEAHISYFAPLLSNFSLALQTFIEVQRPSFTPKEDISADVLQMHVLCAYVSLHLDHLASNDRSSWQEYLPQMNEILVLGQKVISSLSLSSGNDHSDQKTSFCLDMGYIIPLYSVASHCRDPVIRRQAISLLRSSSRQEGLWNSLLVAMAAEKMMELEESELKDIKSSIVDQNRTRSSQPFLQLDGSRTRFQ